MTLTQLAATGRLRIARPTDMDWRDLDPLLLDELAMVFAEAALQRLWAQAEAEDDSPSRGTTVANAGRLTSIPVE